MHFFEEQFGTDALLRGEGPRVRRIEHGDQNFQIVPDEEVLLVLNLTGEHRISGCFDGRFRSETPLVHSISVMPPGGHFDFVVEGKCRILALTVPVDRHAGREVEPRFNVADPSLAGFIWRAAIRDDDVSLADLRQHLVERAKSRSARANIPAARLHRVFRFVERELACSISTADMAAVAGMSMFHFSRAFADETGTTPHRYVLGRRLARAMTALERGSVLEEAAFDCGFANASHLAHHLRTGTGVTSQTLRKFLLN